MASRRPINPDHHQHRAGLRTFGLLLAVPGGILTAIGLVSFFGAMGGGGAPTMFWCAFLGLPMLGFGVHLLKLGYMGTIVRYVAGETAPVATDTLNYMARETKDAVRDVAGAVAAGLQGAQSPCARCGHLDDTSANFCSQCGTARSGEVACAQCQAGNQPSARFCRQCGSSMVAHG